MTVTDLWDCRIMGKGRKHPEAAVRMNFLHQAATCVLKSTGNKVLIAWLFCLTNASYLAAWQLPMIKFQVLSAALGSHMVAVGQKSQVRVSKEIKRTICKVFSVSIKKRRNYFVKERGNYRSFFQGCHLLQAPGLSSDVTIRGPRKEKKIFLLCHLCKTQRGFLLKVRSLSIDDGHHVMLYAYFMIVRNNIFPSLQEKGPPKTRSCKGKGKNTSKNVTQSSSKPSSPS